MIKKEELQRRTEDGLNSLVDLGLNWLRNNFATEAVKNADKAYNSVLYPKTKGDAISGRVADGIISELNEDDYFCEFEIKKLKSSKGGYHVVISW